MSSSKRRKLDIPPDPPRLSAFAARKALQSIGTSQRTSNKQEEQAPAKDFEKDSSAVSTNVVVPKHIQESIGITAQEPYTSRVEVNNGQSQEELDEAGQSSNSEESRAEPQEVQVDRPPIALSSWRPNQSNFEEFGGALCIKLAPGERLVVLGQFSLRVEKGQVTLMGATLQDSGPIHKIYSLASHYLAVIRCLATEVNNAEIMIQQHESGLETLSALSPLFGNLGNKHPLSVSPPYTDILYRRTKSTYQILFPSTDNLPQTFVQPLISAPEWNAMLAKCSAKPTDTRPPVIMICGPKSSGKSTFAKLLTNKLLFPPVDAFDTSNKPKRAGVALLDIDPGQPEYSVPGQLALLRILDPNFGPPFTHPITDHNNKVIRSHSIGATSPAMDTEHYMSCVVDLLSHYPQMARDGCPLIINTPGWVLGTGLQILVDLISKSNPTTIIYMSQQGPPEVISSLKEAAKGTPVATLPSQVSEYTTRTAAQLRTMQYLSYLHLTKNSSHDSGWFGDLCWSGKPLTSIPPWEIIYSGDERGRRGIVGVMCYGEQPPPELLAEKINGSLVAVVVIDDYAAIPGWLEKPELHGSSSTTKSQLRTEEADSNCVDEDKFRSWQTQTPLILTTPNEGIPYFNPANSITLDPQYSHSIGLALVRGIDVARGRLQVLTPIDPSVLQEVIDARKHIVLVSGKLDTPGWAYTEALMSKIKAIEAGFKAIEAGDNMIIGDDEEDVEDGLDVEAAAVQQSTSANPEDHGGAFGNVPWVEKLEGSQGRGTGSRVWRVRRDLGRQGDGD